MTSIVVLGSGFIGLVSGTWLVDFGYTVIYVDTDQAKIIRLGKGISSSLSQVWTIWYNGM